MNPNAPKLKNQKIVILGVLTSLTSILVLISCSKRDNNVYGTWQVSQGRDTGAIYKFTKNDRLYIFNKYNAETQRTFDFITNDNVSDDIPGRLDEQGRITWEAKKMIQFYPERKYSETEMSELRGPVFKITESSNVELKIDEMAWALVSKRVSKNNRALEKVDEIILIPYITGSEEK